MMHLDLATYDQKLCITDDLYASAFNLLHLPIARVLRGLDSMINRMPKNIAILRI